MSKQYTNHQKHNKFIFLLLIVLMIFSSQIQALKSDKDADFVLLGDNFINLPEIKDGLSQMTSGAASSQSKSGRASG